MLYNKISARNISHHRKLYVQWGHSLWEPESLNMLWLFSHVILDADTWTIIIHVYVSLCWHLESKNFLKMFWLLPLRLWPWQTAKVASELCWQTSQRLSCFQLIVRYDFPKDCASPDGSGLIFIRVISHMLFDAILETISCGWFKLKTAAALSASYQTKVLTA